MNGKNPTREQKKLIEKWGLTVADWLVVKNLPTELVLIHRHSCKTMKTIPKGVGR